jgi:hypothetical protein
MKTMRIIAGMVLIALTPMTNATPEKSDQYSLTFHYELQTTLTMRTSDRPDEPKDMQPFLRQFNTGAMWHGFLTNYEQAHAAACGQQEIMVLAYLTAASLVQVLTPEGVIGAANAPELNDIPIDGELETRVIRKLSTAILLDINLTRADLRALVTVADAKINARRG